MLNIRANDQHLTLALDPTSIRATRMVVPLGGDDRFNIVDACDMCTGIFDLQKFKLGTHLVQLNREVLRLQRDLEDFSQIANSLTSAKREDSDFLRGIICRAKKGEALDMIPMKVSEADDELVLMVSDGTHVSTEIAKPRSGVKNGNLIRLFERDLETSSVAAELLEASLTDRDGAAGTVKF